MRLATSWWQRRSALHELNGHNRKLHYLARATPPGGQSTCKLPFARVRAYVHHSYSSSVRGLDGLWGMCQWHDRAPLGRNEAGMWWRRHDEYDNQ
jgi:predicted dithiol-disulfide oxidoreductase (DUF899 family)